MSKTSIKQLGDELDEAERAMLTMMAADTDTYFFSPDSVPFDEYVAIMKRLHDADMAYGQAVTERHRAKREKFKNRKTPIRARDAFKLRDKKYEAEARVDEIIAARPEFATKREFIDANAAFVTADAIYDYAERKYYHSEESLAVGSHSRPVTDGYVKTGKFKMIDGERVPVLEKIE